jgi:nucleoside-diphosphate-sugar epimerase
MAGDLVLITGATGHIGFRTLRYLLEYVSADRYPRQRNRG